MLEKNFYLVIIGCRVDQIQSFGKFDWKFDFGNLGKLYIVRRYAMEFFDINMGTF